MYYIEIRALVITDELNIQNVHRKMRKIKGMWNARVNGLDDDRLRLKYKPIGRRSPVRRRKRWVL